ARKTTSESSAIGHQPVPFKKWSPKLRRYGKTSPRGRPCARKAVRCATSTDGWRASQRTSSPPAYPDAPATLARIRSICIFIQMCGFNCKRPKQPGEPNPPGPATGTRNPSSLRDLERRHAGRREREVALPPSEKRPQDFGGLLR